jgi:hypothetical protein
MCISNNIYQGYIDKYQNHVLKVTKLICIGIRNKQGDKYQLINKIPMILIPK